MANFKINLGFTSTFTWADPEENLLYIFLLNRVYPTRENSKIYDLNIRSNILQCIYDQLSGNSLGNCILSQVLADICIIYWIMRYGVSTNATTMPRYMASDPRPAAVTRSWTGNQRAATVVTALRINGCPIAIPICAISSELPCDLQD